MDAYLYAGILKELKISAEKFLVDNQDVSNEIEDDFCNIISVVDISTWKKNIDGVTKDVPQILEDLALANKCDDRARCLNSIAMLRCAIADIESAYSNAMDSMEILISSIRDKE